MAKKNAKGMADPTVLKPIDKQQGILQVVVETPKGSRVKYSYDDKTGMLELKKALPEGMIFPFNFGFIPGTKAEDGDPMDVLTLVDQPSFPGCLIEVRPVAVLNMRDSEMADQKVIAVPRRNPRYDQIHTLDQIFPHVRREIEHFFSIYKELEGRVTEMQGWGDPHEARKVITDSRKRYLELRGEPAPERKP